jgi:hypothetical protein
MSKDVGDLLSHPNGKPRLPDAAGPSQRKKGHVGTPQLRLNGGDLTFSPDKRSQEPGQGCPRVLRRGEVNDLGWWDEGTVNWRGACHGLHHGPEDRTEFGIVRITCMAVK